MASINQLHTLVLSSKNIIVQQRFPHVPSEQDIIFEYSNLTFESVTGSPKNQPESWYLIPHEDIDETRCITCSYTKLFFQLQQLHHSLGGYLPTLDDMRIETTFLLTL